MVCLLIFGMAQAAIREEERTKYSVCCIHHPQEVVTFNCEQCGRQMCHICLTNSHRDHFVTLLSSERNLDTLKSKIIPAEKTRLEEITQCKNRVQTDKSDAIKEVKNRSQLLHELIHELEDTIIAKIEGKYNTQLRRVTKLEKESKDRISEAKNFVKEVEGIPIAEHRNLRDLYDKYSKLKVLFSIDIRNILSSSFSFRLKTREIKEAVIKLYENADLPPANIPEVLYEHQDDCNEEKAQHSKTKIRDRNRKLPELPKDQSKELTTFQCHLEGGQIPTPVSVIASAFDGMLWVVYGPESSEIVLCTYNGKLMDQFNLGFPVRDIASYSNGTLLAIGFGNNSIFRKSQHEENLVEFFELEKEPICLSTTGKTVTVVCCKERSERNFSFFRINKSGKILKTIIHTHSTLNTPYKMTAGVGIQKHIYFTEKSGFGKGNVVGLDKKGDVIFLYSGHDSNNLDPSGIVSDHDHIYVADARNNSVHILDLMGNFVTICDLDGVCIEGPESIEIDQQQNLCIGGRNNIIVIKPL